MPQGAPVTITNTATQPIPTSTAAGSAGSTAATPSFQREVGAPTLAMGQAASSVSPAAAVQIVAARAGRRSVTISNITGTQPVYLLATAATTGVTTGFFLSGTVGASVTIGTQAAVFATSPTATQTVSFMETY